MFVIGVIFILINISCLCFLQVNSFIHPFIVIQYKALCNFTVYWNVAEYDIHQNYQHKYIYIYIVVKYKKNYL
jgi:hypothetical protein